MQDLQRKAKDEEGNTILVPQNTTYKQWEKEYKPKLILKQGNLNNNKLKMNWQEQNEILESRSIKPLLHKYKATSYRINKYQNKIMELYHKNNKENMCILDLNTGNLIGNIIEGNKTTVSLDRKTTVKLLLSKKNSTIAIHNHPQNYSFSLADITTYNKMYPVDTMILLTDDYKYYLKGRKLKDYTNEYLIKTYRSIEKEIKKTYNNLNVVERRDLTNQKFFKKVGWIYEKEKN